MMILTSFSLLIPAFSLLRTPRFLTVTLRHSEIAPLPMYCYIPKLRYRVLARKFSAQDLSTSELLRTL